MKRDAPSEKPRDEKRETDPKDERKKSDRSDRSPKREQEREPEHEPEGELEQGSEQGREKGAQKDARSSRIRKPIGRPSGERRAGERELESISTLKESPQRASDPRSESAPGAASRRARAPEPESLENVVASEESDRSEKKEERAESSERLETRVARSTHPQDLEKMRRLAERVYHTGWNRLSDDERLAFLYHSRFLEYLSSKEREREDVRSTMYRFLGAQGKSLGLETRYTIRELNTVTDRFFEQIRTPFNTPDLYRRPANTNYFKDERAN